MTELGSLAISIPTLLTLFGIIIAWQNYRLNKKKDSKQDTQELVRMSKEEEEHRREVETRLVTIEKDVQYIRLSIDKFDTHLEDHEKRLTRLETSCKRNTKGGK